MDSSPESLTSIFLSIASNCPVALVIVFLLLDMQPGAVKGVPAGGLELDELLGPFQSKPFRDSINL